MKKVSEERILQICNDIAEDIDNKPTKKELVACIVYWQNHYSNACNDVMCFHADVLLKNMQMVQICQEFVDKKQKIG
jgi:hypothetical protein